MKQPRENYNSRTRHGLPWVFVCVIDLVWRLRASELALMQKGLTLSSLYCTYEYLSFEKIAVRELGYEGWGEGMELSAMNLAL